LSKRAPQTARGGDLVRLRHLDLKNQQCNRDGKYAIAESFEPVCGRKRHELGFEPLNQTPDHMGPQAAALRERLCADHVV
jgi:hypothetical protein